MKNTMGLFVGFVMLLGMILSMAMFSGCTSAGPYVTSISSDGNCNLFIEKSSTEYNMITGTVGNKSETGQITLKVCNAL